MPLSVKENISESPSRSTNDPQRSQQVAVSFSGRQFAHFLSRQGQQMAVSPSRRQFVPLAIGKWQSSPQGKTVCLLNTQEIDKWQFLQTVCLFLGCFILFRVDKWQFSS